MKQDMDLIRKILLKMDPNLSSGNWVDMDVEGHSSEEVFFHIKLLREADMIDGYTYCVSLDEDTYRCTAKSLTWQGQELLEASRDELVWTHANEIALERYGVSSLALLIETLAEIIPPTPPPVRAAGRLQS